MNLTLWPGNSGNAESTCGKTIDERGCSHLRRDLKRVFRGEGEVMWNVSGKGTRPRIRNRSLQNV